VGAAALTPFESARRVFVLERVDTMSDTVANRLLKTLEEPPHFVVLILMTEALGKVIETVVSRCQPVRFDPLPATRIAELLAKEGVPAERAEACGRLALGNATRARLLASSDGEELRAEVERFVAAALAGADRDARAEEPWAPLLQRAAKRGKHVEDESADERDERAELEPKGRDRRALEKQFDDAGRRDARRARTELLDLSLNLATLAFRDLTCLAEDAPGAVLATDRAPALAERARGRDPRRLREAAERCEEVRRALELNVNEELALSALSVRLSGLVGTA